MVISGGWRLNNRTLKVVFRLALKTHKPYKSHCGTSAHLLWMIHFSKQDFKTTIPTTLCIPRECIYFPGSRHSQWGDGGLYSNRLNTVEPLCATAAHKQPPIQNTKIFPVKALQLEPLANDHLLYLTATTFWVSRSIIFHKRPIDAFSALYFGCVHYVP